jgi:putative ATPase
MVRYDQQDDYHYDTISAFIKSVRGSDPDAALHYLARMLVWQVRIHALSCVGCSF